MSLVAQLGVKLHIADALGTRLTKELLLEHCQVLQQKERNLW